MQESWTVSDAVVTHGHVTYTRLDGGERTVPFANVFKLDGPLVRVYLIFADASRLWS